MIRYASVPSAVRTVNGQSLDFQNEDANSIGSARFTVNVTAASGTTPALTFFIEEHDPVSNSYLTVLQSAAISATGQTILRVGPGLPVTANLSVNDVLPRNFRVRWTITGTTPSFTFSVGINYG